MTKKQKLIIGLAMVAIGLIATIGIFTPQGGIAIKTITERLGGITNFNSLTLSDNLVVDGTSVHTGVATFTVSPVFTSGIDNLIQGGGVLATTTASISSTTTLALADLRDYNYFEVVNMSPLLTGALSDAAYQLPATSTMISLLPTIGDTREWLFHNATSSATTLTFVAGTGMDLVSVTNADDIIDSGEWAGLKCTRITYRGVDNENIMCIVSELANSD